MDDTKPTARRRHDTELKTLVLEQCKQPGAAHATSVRASLASLSKWEDRSNALPAGRCVSRWDDRTLTL